ncbi:MAG: glycosyltransferase family 4 protein [Geminicoccaceae bacterium]
MGRMLLRLLENLGHEPVLASRFRSYEGAGDPDRQEQLRQEGEAEASKVLDAMRGRRPDIWLTYHLYHKAPDWLGPKIASALGIPYVVVEASLAQKQFAGPWRSGFLASRTQIEAADVVLAMTARDAGGLAPLVRPEALRRLPPFIDTEPLRQAAAERAGHRNAIARDFRLDGERPWLLAVAMMREDVKLASYRLLAQALRGMSSPSWQLLVVGDGPARTDVEALFEGLPVAFVGSREETALPAFYAAADLYVWPACDEAYGMAMLEAAAAGLPVVAGREGGVPDIVEDGVSGILVEPRDPRALGAAVDRLLDDVSLCRTMGSAAASRARERHSLDAAGQIMTEALGAAVAAHRIRKDAVTCASA